MSSREKTQSTFSRIRWPDHSTFSLCTFILPNLTNFDTISLFITPTLDDMLSEKLFYYTKYFKIKKLLEKGEPIKESKYSDLTKEDCDYLLYKFKRAILKLVEAIIKRDYMGVKDYDKTQTSRLILRGFIGNFEDYTNEEKEETIASIFP